MESVQGIWTARVLDMEDVPRKAGPSLSSTPPSTTCHVGIPMIAIAVLLVSFAAGQPRWWELPVWLFVAGWVFQFVGHAFERKPPEFFHDWRFLLVGLRWWFAKMVFVTRAAGPGARADQGVRPTRGEIC